MDHFKLHCLWVPLISIPEDFSTFLVKSQIPQCEIYVSEDFLINEGKLLCLIQGTGEVRAGLWARSVCINHSLELGTMIPYVRDAQSKNMSVCIFNPNERKDTVTGDRITEFTTMENHCLWVYENIIKKFSKAKEIYFVSHSMGGYCTVDIISEYSGDLNSGLIRKIAFTDSVHGGRWHIFDSQTRENFVQISRNYVTSDEPVGTPLATFDKCYDGVDNYSSGHTKHEYTSGCAREEIFKYFEEKSRIEFPSI